MPNGDACQRAEDERRDERRLKELAALLREIKDHAHRGVVANCNKQRITCMVAIDQLCKSHQYLLRDD